MEFVENTLEDIETEAIRHQLAKLVLGTAAGFVAKNLVEKLYDSWLESHRSKKIPSVQ